MRIKLLIITFLFIFSLKSGFAQSEMISTRHALIDWRYHLFRWPVPFYSKLDASKDSLKVNIDPEIKGDFTGAGDFLFFVDSLGTAKVKLVNIEIRDQCSRFFDWRTFIKPSEYNDYDIYYDVGIGIDQLDETDMFDRTRAIARAMLEELERSIGFYPAASSGNRITYIIFSF